MSQDADAENNSDAVLSALQDLVAAVGLDDRGLIRD